MSGKRSWLALKDSNVRVRVEMRSVKVESLSFTVAFAQKCFRKKPASRSLMQALASRTNIGILPLSSSYTTTAQPITVCLGPEVNNTCPGNVVAVDDPATFHLLHETH